ncbi:ABC transporter permease [Salinisphaera hydrothermalis]|uniref:Binding-protein-dependent transport system inner membrane protein n=1 Tax=Salinisphaera hydrothermalis (strain C41B8) TaxID=1304275 RepID=A0A084IG81_SALHC|nr:ABC transporter permease [Salinisphaera hydrothermalis]KEZ75715.1 binding-protein-dependent transport system inner membrane protein [Salinisphaera hydrothermalis C41B8]
MTDTNLSNATDATRLPRATESATLLTPRQMLRRRAVGHWGLMIGGVLLAAIVLIAVFGPMLMHISPYAQDLTARLMPPVWAGGSWDHVFGTDHLGRDYLARILIGARISLTVGFLAATLGCVIGVSLGLAAGYFGGRVDQVVSYLLTCQLSLPELLLAMVLVFLIGPSLWVVIGVIGILHWTYYLVIARSAAMRIRELDFVAAARALGSPTWRVLGYEILPNLRSQVIVIFTIEMGTAILSEAALSFLGVGIQSPTPAWGLMIAQGRETLFFDPWLCILPGAALFILIMAVNLFGDGLRDVLTPEGRR